MENTKPKEILENIISIMEKTHTDEWEIDKLVVVLNYINELEKENEKLVERVQIGQNAFLSLSNKIDKSIEYIESRARKAGVKLMPREKELLSILRGKDNE